jgi:hypothetical protein
MTCANRGDGHHVALFGDDLGVLVPTRQEWVCPFCEYRQPYRDADLPEVAQ